MRAWKPPAPLTASCPVIASTTYSRSDAARPPPRSLELAHQLVVDVQPPGGVDDERVEAEILRRRSAPDARATGSISPAGSCVYAPTC